MFKWKMCIRDSIESEKGLNHRIYYVTTKDFNTFSETKLFFNPDFSVIDAAIAVSYTHLAL